MPRNETRTLLGKVRHCLEMDGGELRNHPSSLAMTVWATFYGHLFVQDGELGTVIALANVHHLPSVREVMAAARRWERKAAMRVPSDEPMPSFPYKD